MRRPFAVRASLARSVAQGGQSGPERRGRLVFLLEGGRTKSAQAASQNASAGFGLRTPVPRSARALLGRFPFPREKGTEKGTEENVAGAEWKTRHLAEVWFYVLSLIHI